MIVIYDNNETNFESNGLGIITSATNCLVYEELNGRYDVELEILNSDKYIENIKENNIVKVNVSGKADQLFRIKTIERNIKTTRVIAYHITYDLNDNFLVDIAPTNQTCFGALQWILDRAVEPHRFFVTSDISKIASARYVRKTLTEAIISADNSIINVWDGELDRDNFNIKVLTSVGEDRGYKIIYGKNLKEIKWMLDISEVTTKIMPQGADELLLPELFIESPNISNYPSPIIRKIEFPNIKVIDEPAEDEEPISIEQAQAMLRDAVYKLYEKGIDKPKVTINIDMVELSKTAEYQSQYKALEKVYIGDTVTAYIPSLNIDVKLKVVAITYDSLKNTIESITIGEKQSNYFEDENKTVNKEIQDIKTLDLPSTLKEAKKTATQLINFAMGGYVHKTNAELFIMDKDNIYEAVRVWRWNLNGLGYSTTGVYGNYEIAITADGQIVADFITTGKLRGDIIEAGSITLGAISNDATDKMISQSGAENLIKNSSGLNGYEYWVVSGTLPTCVNDTEVIEKTEAEMCFRLTNTVMKQTISVIEANEYTLSFKIKKGTGTSKIKIIQTDKEEIVLDSGVNEQINWLSFNKTIKATGTVITIQIEDSSSYLQVADLMLVDGAYPKVWTAANGEIYTPNTRIDGNGVKVSNKSNSNTFIASNEKTGVYKGIQKIFDVDNETVTMKNAVISDIVGSTLQIGKIQQVIRSDGLDFIYVE